MVAVPVIRKLVSSTSTYMTVPVIFNYLHGTPNWLQYRPINITVIPKIQYIHVMRPEQLSSVIVKCVYYTR